MKKLILAAVLALCLGLTAAAAAGPTAQLKETSIDAGQVLQGQVVDGVFWVDNPGDAVLEIKKVSPG